MDCVTGRMDGARIEAAVRELLAGIGEDPDREGLQQTPERVAAAYAEFFAGIGSDPVAVVRDGAIPADDAHLGELVVVRDIRFRSVCEHHLLPFIGVAHVAYAPADRIIGLGTIARVIDAIATRPQLQERLGEQTAEALEVGLLARGVLVVLDAVHQCVTTRGERQTASSTVTIASRGTLATAADRAEALALVLGRSADTGVQSERPA